jgi:predicted pyridoxine 5'-phosphate oxidase superfamily flavin-nucleotide-binding protein
MAQHPWHVGERSLHARLGIGERMDELGARVIRDHMPDQHREFFAQLPFVVVGSVDAQGHTWASVLAGAPGFVHSPDARTLTIAARPDPRDPAGEGLALGDAIGLLGIELHTRRRNRMNGTITGVDAAGLRVAVEQSFGNCPKYIHPRAPVDRARAEVDTRASAFVGLDAPARATIAAADTLFVASHVELDGRRQVDVSHRGGPAGFVRIDDAGTLTIPDYAGNRFFNTLGNIAVQPRVGLVFVELETGSLLQLSGEAELLLEGDPRLATLALGEHEPAPERAWRVHPRIGVHRAGALPFALA